ncbi:hypothetical protein B0H14DRAFT_2828697 [Mycena olivaceomarginata]|nr:hypothetical protein B0H14DRAFT_2828697 [Mycena olivaceomarginata]
MQVWRGRLIGMPEFYLVANVQFPPGNGENPRTPPSIDGPNPSFPLTVTPSSGSTSPAYNQPRADTRSTSSAGFCCYVLIPPAPDFVRRYQEKRLTYCKQGMEEPELDTGNIDVKELKGRRGRGIYQNTENGAQAAAMLQSVSRIAQVPCRWLACTAVLNSVESLLAHVCEVHAQEHDEPSTCRWDTCGEGFPDRKRLILHSESHILETIHCAYQDCGQVFKTPCELVVHNLRHAHQRTALRPSTRPNAPHQLLPLPELAENIPAWAILAPAVRIPPISRARLMRLASLRLRR